MKRYMVFTGELREPYDEKPSDGPFVDVYKVSEVDQAAKLWAALTADVNALPCKHPDLRDCLHDWMKARAAHNTEPNDR